MTGLVVAVAAAVFYAVTTKHGTIFGRSVWWLDDDMMISLRYARNCAAGDGLVWNAGEYVEGYTNFAWTLLAVPWHFIAPATHVSLALIACNVFLLGALAMVTHRLVKAMGGDGVAALVASLALATSAPLLHWTVGGGEALTLAVLLTILAQRVVSRPPVGALDGLLVALAIVTRPDAAVAAVILFAARAGSRARSDGPRLPSAPPAHGIARACLVAISLPLAQVGFRLLYYGELLPNTYWLKATGFDGRVATGLRYVAGLAVPLLAWILAASASASRHVALAAAIAAQLAYVAWIGGDELPMHRFLLPVLPILVALGVLGAQRLGARVPTRARVLAPVVTLGLGGLSLGVLPGQIPELTARRSMAETGNVMIGMLLAQNTDRSAKVAHFWAGAAAYFSERIGIDMLGKCDPTIARTRAHEGLHAPGHNKYDFDISLGRAPDVVVSGTGGAANDAVHAEYAASDYRAFADLYRHPGFRRDFMPQLVGADASADPGVRLASMGWHGIYVRAGTAAARPADRWVSPAP